MKLLIITQVVDKNHPILGFFHRWIEEFAAHSEQVTVICLQMGEYNLPGNVRVHSLGKEEGKGRLVYLYRFYAYIWNLRHDYDSVFVHMNQIYVILGAPLWRPLKKKIGLWYAHGTVSNSLRVAEKAVNYIFTCSANSFRLKSKKILVTGHGIDTVRFAPSIGSSTTDLITVGRITKAKNLFTLIDILHELRKTTATTLTIVGAAVTPSEHLHEAELKAYSTKRGLTEAVIFKGSVTQTDLPTLLQGAKVFVTTAQNGSLDKAMLEAMACGLPVVSMAQGSISLPLGSAQTSDIAAFITEVKKVLESGMYKNLSYTDFVVKHHSLQVLIPKIISMLS